MYRLLYPFFLLIVLSCKPEPTLLGPAATHSLTLPRQSQTINNTVYNSKVESRTTTVQFTFDADCRPKERAQISEQKGYPPSRVLIRYTYDAKGFLVKEAYYERGFDVLSKEDAGRYMNYDAQGRIRSILVYPTPPGQYQSYLLVYQYENEGKKITRYQCREDSSECRLRVTYVDGEQTFPTVDQRKDTYYTYSPGSDGGIVRSTHSRDDQLLKLESFMDPEEKQLVAETIYQYDDKKQPLTTVPDAYFKGFPQLKPRTTPHNLLRVINPDFHRLHDDRSRIERVYTYEYNVAGYPVKGGYREIDGTTGKATGVSQETTYSYNCK